jgi:large subunit ribosomal protein L6
MSRIGKKAIALPKGVTASVDGQTVKVKGPKGELSVKLVAEVSATVDDHGIHVTPRKDMEKAPQMWGLSRTLVNNLVASPPASPRSWKSRASAIARRCKARC